MYLGGYISQDIFNAAFTYFVAFALGITLITVVASNYLGGMSWRSWFRWRSSFHCACVCIRHRPIALP